MSPAKMYSRAASTARWYCGLLIDRVYSGTSVSGVSGGGAGRVRQRLREVGDERVEPGAARAYASSSSASVIPGVTNTFSMRNSRWRKWSNAVTWPVSVMTASGQPTGIGRHVGQALHLAHDVVAEVADDAAVERRERVELRRPVVREQRLDRGERAGVGGDAVGDLPRHLHVVAARDQRDHRDRGR